MFVVILLLKFYIIVLIFRGVFTSQELYFNPFGKLVASMTEPVFANLFKGKSKVYTDRFIPVFIVLIILLQFLLNYLTSFNVPVSILVNTIQDNLNFLMLFYIFSIFVGGGKGTVSSFYSVYFYRIGLPWVKFTRKFIRITDNKIMFPAMLMVFLIYILLSLIVNASFDFAMTGSFNIVSILISVAKMSLFAISDIFFYIVWLVVFRALISWVSPDPRNPVVQILYSLTEPILAPFRKIIPPIGFIDLSAIVAIVVLEVLRNLIIRLVYML
jgi:YggT family protein